MPFLIPTKRSSISKSMRFSKYKNIEESQYFQLQKRKSSKEPGDTGASATASSMVGRWQAKSSKHPTYRIITKGHPYYEVAYDFDLDQIKLREWNYIINELPRHLPGYLSQSARTKWLLAHFTQLALETDGAQPQIESDDDDDDTGKAINKSSKTNSQGQGQGNTNIGNGGNNSTMIPGSPMLITSGNTSNATSPMTATGSTGAITSSSSSTMSSLSLGSTASITASPARNQSSASSSSSLSRPPLPVSVGVISRSGSGGTPHASSGSITTTLSSTNANGFGNLSSDDDKARSSSGARVTRSVNVSSSSSSSSSMISSISSSSSLPSSRVRRANDGSGSPFTAPPLSVATPPGARFSLRGRRAFWILLLFTNCIVLLLRDASISSCFLILLLLDLLLYSAIVRGEPVAFTIFVTRGHPTVASIPVESSITANVSSSSSSSRGGSRSSKSSRHSPYNGPVEDVHAARFAPGTHITTISTAAGVITTPIVNGAPNGSGNGMSGNDDTSRSMIGNNGMNGDHEGKAPRVHDNDNKASDSDNEGDQGSDDGDREDGDDKDGASPVPTPMSRTVPSAITNSHVSNINGGSGSVTSTAPHASTGTASSSSNHSGIPRFAIGQSVGKIPESSPMVGNTGKTSGWCSVDGTTFQVRLPGYKVHRKKGNSAPALYDIFGADAYRCPDRKVDNIMKLSKMPPIPPHLWPAGWQPSSSPSSDDGRDWPDCSINGVPPLIVIHFQIPEYAPANPVWGKGREDGEGYSMVMYFWLTEYGKQEALANRNPAIKLFQEFLRRDGDIDFRNRFKCIARVQNPDDCNLGGMLKSTLKRYNAKPWLTGPLCHEFLKGFNYMEADIDVHRFSYFGRQAAAGFLPQLHHFVFDLAFTVEGQDDRELPEQVLCCCRLFKLLPLQAKTIGYYQEQERKEQLERNNSNAINNGNGNGITTATVTNASSTTSSSSSQSSSTSSSSGVTNVISPLASPISGSTPAISSPPTPKPSV